MAYVPASLDNIRPGISATTWGTAATNHDQLYRSAYCHVFSDTNTQATTSSKDSTWTDNPYVLAFRTLGNADQQTLRFMVHLKTSNAGYAAQVRASVTFGTTNVGVGSSTSTSGEWVTFDVTITTESSDRTVYLNLRMDPTTPGTETATLNGVLCYIKPSAPAAGVLNSGFISLDTDISDVDYPISTELVQRVTDGPRRIAIDRPVCIVSLGDDLTASRNGTTSTINEVILSGRFYLPDRMARNYTVAVFQGPPFGGTADTAVSEVVIGGISTGAISGNYFQDATIKLDGYQADNSGLQPKLIDYTVYLKSTGGNPVFLKTLQIFRSP